MARIGAEHWLRIALGELCTARTYRTTPSSSRSWSRWTAARHIRRHKPVFADHGGPLVGMSSAASSLVSAVPLACPACTRPRRLPHILATQAINRGMPLEAKAALHGHSKTRRKSAPRSGRFHATPRAQLRTGSEDSAS